LAVAKNGEADPRRLNLFKIWLMYTMLTPRSLSAGERARQPFRVAPSQGAVGSSRTRTSDVGQQSPRDLDKLAGRGIQFRDGCFRADFGMLQQFQRFSTRFRSPVFLGGIRNGLIPGRADVASNAQIGS